ncbi:formylglycine-generating enzyme family protein [Bremerella sp. T1]|uniref:formylglycine-generating enzyme family protein n=1 Tax=Bremerella sp. TYQ1 TaxID=3119568 RepID=UPI001CC9A3D1|nr:SUMF1/EgtB/PvdO family nonheme iron enzyme [Bremerella volcania]UBM34287.1 formylglycine-generating enzyme family protein [Bremerella volcania]
MHKFVLTLAMASVIAVSASAAEVAGISSTKPDSGPYVETDKGFMVPYEVSIPGSKAKLKMIPVPGGTFKLGSPESEAGHTSAEAPEVEVEVGPFWMAEHETTWEQYQPYMELYQPFKDFKAEGIRAVTDENKIDAITVPTPLYEPSFTYEYGEDPKLPAVTMTNYSARQYTKWLSGVTGQQYRLPSEAEWEYAALGGAKTAYHFGDDPEKLEEYGWFVGNSDESPQLVKKKKPNQYGLYDMHGNVWEWVLDQYSDEGFKHLAGKEKLKALDTVVWPTELDLLMVKGGGWDEEPQNCRAASKMGSSESDWKEEDPNIPLSPWWFTSYPSTMVGFRVIRPLEELPKKDAVKFYVPEIEFLNLDVSDRLIEGRGVLGLADPSLIEALEENE